jgi:type II secretory pathway pseudopilin PulG
MAVLLVGMSVAAVLMTAAMPVWKQVTRREKEAELIFRGQQYVRAIALFQKRSGPGVLPPNVDVLVTGRYLRKKFTDPITNQDFDLLSPVQAAGQAPGVPGQAPGVPGQAAGGRGGAGQQGRGAAPPATGGVFGAQPGSGGAVGGIIGVASKSKETSVRIFNGRTHYNEWQFIFVQQAQAPAGAGGGGRAGTPPPGGQQGGPGRQGQGPGRGFGPAGPGRGGRGIQPTPPPSAPSSPFQPRPPG